MLWDCVKVMQLLRFKPLLITLFLCDLFPFLPLGDTFSSSPSTTPMGSQESLSSHSSEKNGLSQSSPPSSPPADPGASSLAPASPASPPAASSCSPPHNCLNEKDQKQSTESIASHHLTPSSSWTSSQLNPAQQTSSVSSSMSSLLSVERTLSAKGNSTASLSSVKESTSPSRASSSTVSIQHSSVERTSSLREGRAVQRVSSVCSLKSNHSVDQRNGSGTSFIVKETRMTDSTCPSKQQRTAYRTASSSSSSSSSLFPYPLSTSSSLTSLHISEGTYISFAVCKNILYKDEGLNTDAVTSLLFFSLDFMCPLADYKSCHGSVQSLMSLEPHTRKTHTRCGSDLTAKRPAAASSNGYQRPGSL